MTRFPPKRILVAYDLSDVSRTAWHHAKALAASVGASLELLYVEPWRMGAVLMPRPRLSPARAAKLRGRIREATDGSCGITLLAGDPAPLILSRARALRADLIVVGTHGRTGLERALLGSVAEEVIRGARVPVLAARGRPRPIVSILAPVNFTPYSDRGFEYAAGAAAGLSARLTVLHLSSDPIWSGNPRYRMSSLVESLPPGVRSKCLATIEAAVAEDAVDGILKARRGHEWIVLVAHKKSPLGDALFGTTLERALRRSSIPVLCVPAVESKVLAPSA